MVRREIALSISSHGGNTACSQEESYDRMQDPEESRATAGRRNLPISISSGTS